MMRAAPQPSPAQLHTVRKGETLWAICARQLRRAGARPTNRAICEAVDKVARGNALRNPDLIRVGQVLDLSALPGLVRPAGLGQGAVGLAPQHQASAPRKVADLAELIGAILARNPAADAVSSQGPSSRILGGPARVSSDFGFRKDPFTGRRQHHNGIDLAVPTGTPIYPLKSGRVVFSGPQRGYGNVVIVRHDNGMETVYAHNARNLARVGQRVTGRTPLGLSGSTGRSTGPHLHFEVRVHGRPVNPWPFLPRESVQVAQAL